MIKLNHVKENYDPLDKMLAKLKPHFPERKHFADMQRAESGFIGGLLETYRPKKLLEVGVSAGGTTAMILQFFEDNNEPYEMHSVDINNIWGKEEVGLLTVFAKKNNLIASASSSVGTHEFHLGKYLPQVIDEIGGDIDFVVLDTMHTLPGELLDFPVMLPYLKDGAIVVLHDVSLNQRSLKKNASCATGLLFSAVTAPEKFLNSEVADKNQPFRYPNIGAFKVNDQTRERIENVFTALTLNWHYLPGDAETAIYREFYAKHYPAELITVFDETVRLNRKSVAFRK